MLFKGEAGNALKIAGIYAATVIGAGFASGRELLQFFTCYEKGGIYGILAAGALFSAIGGIMQERVYSCRIRNFREFIIPAAGRFLGRIIQWTAMLFMLSLFAVMLAGLSNIMASLSGMPYAICAPAAAALCFLAIRKGVGNLARLGSAVTPVLIFGIFLTGFYIISFKDQAVFSISGLFGRITDNWLSSAILYVSYNGLMAVVAMCGMLPVIRTKKAGIMGGVAGGLLLCFTAIVLNTALSLFYPGAAQSEIPVLGILERLAPVMGMVYMPVLGLAMYISAVTSGFCFSNELSQVLKLDMRIVAGIICVLALPATGFGFSKLIALLYPVFGYAGLFLIFVVLGTGLQAALKSHRRI